MKTINLGIDDGLPPVDWAPSPRSSRRLGAGT